LSAAELPDHASCVVDRQGLQSLIGALHDEGYVVIGPRVADQAIVLDQIQSVDSLPAGVRSQEGPGRSRLLAGDKAAMFDYGPTPQGWKRFLYPPSEKLWRCERDGTSFRFRQEGEGATAYAFLGVRACDLRALQTLDRVFDEGRNAYPRYAARRHKALVIAVNCTRPCGTGFCASMGAGPRADHGYDLVLTEVVRDSGGTMLLIEAGTSRGAGLLQKIDRRPADEAEIAAAEAACNQTAASMNREMVPDVATLLKRNLEHRQWAAVADRCLTCGNCTMVCPTCFCSTVEDVTDLSGAMAEQWRRWDSCFTIDFSYIHGGSIRRDGASRYRQWMTHKLSFWWEQFGCSGCVGCGRCITWCPVGIDITEEARHIAESE
jgi:ferredoxin